MTEKKLEHVVIWQFIASRNDDEIYAYGSRFHAKQFCHWLNYKRTSDHYTYGEFDINKISLVEHTVFSLREAIDTKALPPSDYVVPKKVKRGSIAKIITAANCQELDKAQLEAKILLAIDAVIKWNINSPKKFAINTYLLERITNFNNLLIRDVVIKHQRAIDQYHTSLGWNEPPHNKSCGKKNFEDLEGFVNEVLQPPSFSRD